MGLCNVTNKTKQERMNTMSDMYNYWISKRNIVDRFSDGREDIMLNLLLRI